MQSGSVPLINSTEMFLGRQGQARAVVQMVKVESEPYDTSWNSWWNAEVYDRFVREASVYRVLNERLAELADLGAARRVLDLGCGTGATAQACLARMPSDGELVGVDASPAMVELARANTVDPRARFEVSAAEAVNRAVEGPFDRVVCNAAMGQLTDRRATLRAVADLMPAGLLVFDLAADRVDGQKGWHHPLQATLARLIEARSDSPYTAQGAQVDPDELDDLLEGEGFTPAQRSEFNCEPTREELLRLLEVPAIFERMAPQLTAEQRQDVLDQARKTGDGSEVVAVPWIFFRSQRL